MQPRSLDPAESNKTARSWMGVSPGELCITSESSGSRHVTTAARCQWGRPRRHDWERSHRGVRGQTGDTLVMLEAGTLGDAVRVMVWTVT
jgi:hypothetical protein